MSSNSGFWPRVAFKEEKFSDAVSPFMRLSRVEFDVYLNANFPTVSQSTMTMTFQNDHNRVLEGELQFTLPKNSTVCGYGVDIDGVMVDAVPIEKEKGKVVFEAVRKRTTATPAIAEMVKGNTFKTRIYPLPANGSRKVRLSYETRVPLARDSPYTHRVPATIAEGIGELSVRCHCVGFCEHTAPVYAQIESASSVRGRQFDFVWQRGDAPGMPGKFVGELSATARDYVYGAVSDIRVALPFRGSLCAIEPEVEVEGKEDEVGAYFRICDDMVSSLTSTDSTMAPTSAGREGQSCEGQAREGHPDEGQRREGQPREGQPREGRPDEGCREGRREEGRREGGGEAEEKFRAQHPDEVVVPAHVGIVWDCSLSRNVESAREQDLLALRALLEQDDAWNDTTISVVGLRNVWGRPVELSYDKKRGWEELYDVLKKTNYDGATNLSAANFEARWTEGQEKPFDFFLLFSDGLSTVGSEKLPDADAHIYTINFGSSGGRHNHELLRYISEKSGGRYFDMTSGCDIGGNFEHLKRRIGRPAMRFLGAVYDKELVSVIAPTSYFENDTFVVSGTLNAEEATLVLKYGYTAGEPVLLREFTLRMSDAVPSGGMVRRQWARQRMRQLLPMPIKNKEELTAIGRKYSILTPGTSFVVLETIQQHIEHKIAPHPLRKVLRELYDAHMECQRLEEEETLQNKIATVSEYLREREDWYERNFEEEHALEQRRKKTSHQTEELTEFKAIAKSRRWMDFESVLNGSSYFEESDSDSDYLEWKPPEQKEPPSLRQSPVLTGNQSALLSVRAWHPGTPYMTHICLAKGKHRAYAEYLKVRPQYERSPSFYFDVSSFFEEKYKWNLIAARIISNVLELNLENAQVLRTVGHKLLELEMTDAAAEVFESVKRLCPREPQSYRDLALALLDKTSTVYDPSRALRLLDEVITGTWDERFKEIELVCLLELAHAVDTHGFDRATLSTKPGLRTPERLLRKFDVDLRIVLSWDTDNTDIHLDVYEPAFESCCYYNRSTRIGGQLSCNFDEGFGPEEYLLKNALSGNYSIAAHYYSNYQQSLTGATTLLLAVFTDYGDQRKEKRHFMSVRLPANREIFKIGVVKFR